MQNIVSDDGWQRKIFSSKIYWNTRITLIYGKLGDDINGTLSKLMYALEIKINS